MSDDLDDLKAAMDTATPPPDAAKKAAHLALARQNFDQLQGSRPGTRPTSDRPARGLFGGVAKMFSTLSSRGAMTATTALVAVGIVISLPMIQKLPLSERAPIPMVVSQEEQAAKPAPMPAAADEDGQRAETSGRIHEAPASGSAPEPRAMAEGGATLGFLNAAPEPQADYSVARKRAAPIPSDQFVQPEMPDSEAYPEATPNALKITADEPVSTFSIDVDTASYAIVRSSIMAGQMPPLGAVRVEEMINYFPYDYPAPEAGEAPFRPTVTVAPTPWNTGTQLVHIAIQGREMAAQRPPLNLVFLIDTSGSMNRPDKLPLLKQSLALMLPRLGAQDQVAIVAYAGSAGQVLAPTPATDRAAIMAALDRLAAGGSTAGQAGLQQAYAVAAGMTEDGDVTRVILATDGDFNVGLSDPDALKSYIADKRQEGTYLSVMGFGRGNLDDATMQALAQNGNGQAAYIDTLSEAQKVLVDQFGGALFPIANDVKIQVEFNPAQVAEYRLIGYETRGLRREDFNNDKVDAGDIGAGHSVTAIYEITPTDSPARLSDPLRYQAVDVTAASEELGFLKLRYKAPGATASQMIETPILPGTVPDSETRFAAAISGFGQLLSHSVYLGDWGYDDAITLATDAVGDDPFGYRAEAVRLMRLAASLSRQ
jgi:Ca-activated chloride channel family protein